MTNSFFNLPGAYELFGKRISAVIFPLQQQLPNLTVFFSDIGSEIGGTN